MGVLPLQFRDGESAATLRPRRQRDLLDRRRRRHRAAPGRHRQGHARRRLDARPRRALPHRYLSTSSNITAPAASSTTCCGTSRHDARPVDGSRRLDRRGADPRRLWPALGGQARRQEPAYQWLNVVGALGFIANSSWNGAWPSAALNVIWVGIGVVALIRIFGKRETRRALMRSTNQRSPRRWQMSARSFSWGYTPMSAGDQNPCIAICWRCGLRRPARPGLLVASARVHVRRSASRHRPTRPRSTPPMRPATSCWSPGKLDQQGRSASLGGGAAVGRDDRRGRRRHGGRDRRLWRGSRRPRRRSSCCRSRSSAAPGAWPR